MHSFFCRIRREFGEEKKRAGVALVQHFRDKSQKGGKFESSACLNLLHASFGGL